MARKTGFLGIGPTYPNISSQAYASLVAGTTATPTGMGPANLATEEPSEVARIATLDPRRTYFKVSGAGGALTFDIDGAALVNLNLSPGGYFRFIDNTPSTTTAAPTSIAASSNITGVVGDVDEAITNADGTSASDSAYIAPTVPTSQWSARFAFTPTYATPKAGAARTVVVLRVARVNSGGAYYPSIRCELWGGGVKKMDLGARALTEADQVFAFPFDAGDAAFTPGDAIHVKIISNASVIGGDPYAKLDTISLEYETSNPGSDSGWQASPFVADGNAVAPTKSVHYFWTSTQAGRQVLTAWVLDDQSQHFDTSVSDSTGISVTQVSIKPSGYFQAGCFVAGPALFLTRSPRVSGQSLRVIVEERGGVTEGGQTYAADAFRRRAASIDLVLTQDEADALMDGLLWRRGHAGAFYVALDADVAATYQRFSAFWATLKEAGDLTQLPVKGAGSITVANRAYALSLTLEEKL